MGTVSELVSANIENLITNFNAWGGILLNVKAYGAKGDGTTDDTAALNATVAAAQASGGGIVYIPDGTYRTSSPVAITSSNIWIAGKGTIYKDFETSSAITAIGTAIALLSGIKIRGIRVLKSPTVTPIGQFGIQLDYCDSPLVIDCTVQGGLTYATRALEQGILARNCIKALITQNTVFNISGNGISLDKIIGASDICEQNIISNNRIYNIGDCAVGVHNSVSDCLVKGNMISDVSVAGIDIASCQDCRFAYNTIDRTMIGIRALKNLAYANFGNIIEYNQIRGISGTDPQGIKIFDTGFITVRFNKILNTGLTAKGIYIGVDNNTTISGYVTGNDYTISDNEISGFDKGIDFDIVNGFNSTGDLSRNKITGCTTGINAAAAGTKKYRTFNNTIIGNTSNIGSIINLTNRAVPVLRKTATFTAITTGNATIADVLTGVYCDGTEMYIDMTVTENGAYNGAIVVRGSLDGYTSEIRASADFGEVTDNVRTFDLSYLPPDTYKIGIRKSPTGQSYTGVVSCNAYTLYHWK